MKTKITKYVSMALSTSLIILSTTGCIKPYNKPSVIQIETNEIAFLVDMRSDGSVAADQMVPIQKKDIVIEGYWVKTGRWENSGHYRPSQKVLVVSSRPIEANWSEDSGGPIVRAVSKESVGFRVPLVLNATIQNEADAEKYLNWFRSNTTQTTSEESMKNVKEEAEPLESAVNRVIFPVINNVLSSLFLEVPIIEAESYRVEFVRKAFEEAKIEAEKYGITLLILSSTDGLLYDDPSFQNGINELAVAKMRENVIAQENRNAQAEQEKAKTEANTAAEVAKIKAATLDIERMQMEIEGQRRLFEAEAQAIIERSKNQWPTTLVVQDLEMLGQLGVMSNSVKTNQEYSNQEEDFDPDEYFN